MESAISICLVAHIWNVSTVYLDISYPLLMCNFLILFLLLVCADNL